MTPRARPARRAAVAGVAALARLAAAAGVAAALAGAAAAPGAAAADRPAGLFAGAQDIARARGPGADAAALADPARAAARRAFLAHADGLLDRAPDPFVAAPPDALRMGAAAEGPRDDSLHGAILKGRQGGAVMRDLALAFALTGSRRYAEAAATHLRAWAARHRPINFYDHAPDFAAATHRGQTAEGPDGRSWHFGLNAMWQGYGLINAADAWLLLRAGGYVPPPGETAAVEAWLRRYAAAVNSGLHAWSRWADAAEAAEAAGAGAGGDGPHQRGGLGFADAHEMHRTTDHLSWGLAALLAAAAALDDRALADHALAGGVWDDGRSGPYANPSPARALIDRAIEAEPARGRIYEERIGRTPLIGYALFHLEALSLAARIAALHFDADLWGHVGADGAGLADAFARYAPHVAGVLPSPDPAEPRPPAGRWLFALSPEGFGGAERAALRAARPLPATLDHVIGPAALLFAP